jgi:glycyl-tRNA synthetase beta chain
MTDFLLELRSEEIPARMQDKARDDLARLFTAELDKAGLKAQGLTLLSTPRRLALIAKSLPLETQAVSEETKGPKVGAPPQALDGFLRKTGLTQDQLVERDGVFFAVVEKPGRKTADVLAEAIPAIIRAFPWPKSQRWGAASRSTESLRWVRPLQGIVALLGDDVVPCEIDGIVSGSATMGHRFHHSGPVTIGNPADYAMKLRAAHVIVDHQERRSIIRAGAEKAASDAGLVLVPDEGLVNENSGLTEWPVPMLGRFDPAFLAVPEEVIQLTARVNQKYFICRDVDGKLANAFICTANIVARDGGTSIVAGNEKVLAARLSDAKFFWEQDLKIPLEEQAQKLSQIVFHEKLGTVADKVERVAKLARWLCEEGIVKPSPLQGRGLGVGAVSGSSESPDSPHSPTLSPEGEREHLAALAERAARLCKADLVTGMVGEFPELQGVMGGYYARAQGEAPEVADAIRDHYKPVGQGDDVPTAPVTVAVSLADKLDTLVGFFLADELPTGSKDPYALRRSILAQQALTETSSLRFRMSELVEKVIEIFLDQVDSAIDYNNDSFTGEAWKSLFLTSDENGKLEKPVAITGAAVVLFWRKQFAERAKVDGLPKLIAFWADRLKVQQKEAGVRHDLIDAVFALGGEDDLVRLLARVKALQAFVGTEDGKNLLAGYKRAANILKASPSPLVGEGRGEGRDASASQQTLAAADAAGPSPSAPGGAPSSPTGGEGVENALLSALNTAEPKASAAIAAEDFEGAMSALASLRAPIDAFFDGVMVNDPDPEKRAFRMGLLTRFRNAVNAVADFGKIEG